MLAYAVPPVVALFVVGLFWPRANARGALATIIVGLVGGAALFHANVLAAQPLGLHFLLVAPLLFAACVFVLVLVSAFSAPDPGDRSALQWTPASFNAETRALAGQPWWSNYRVQAVALLAATAVLVWWFR